MAENCLQHRHIIIFEEMHNFRYSPTNKQKCANYLQLVCLAPQRDWMKKPGVYNIL